MSISCCCRDGAGGDSVESGTKLPKRHKDWRLWIRICSAHRAWNTWGRAVAANDTSGYRVGCAREASQFSRAPQVSKRPHNNRTSIEVGIRQGNYWFKVLSAMHWNSPSCCPCFLGATAQPTAHGSQPQRFGSRKQPCGKFGICDHVPKSAALPGQPGICPSQTQQGSPRQTSWYRRWMGTLPINERSCRGSWSKRFQSYELCQRFDQTGSGLWVPVRSFTRTSGSSWWRMATSWPWSVTKR